VALSRCKSFEGMVLRSAIGRSSIKTDGTVAAYNKETNENIPDAKKLADSKVEYQRSLMLELFDFSEIKRTLYTLNRSLSENESSIRSGALARCKTIMGAAETDIYPIAERFREKLSKQAAGPALPENDRHIQERIQKASSYFLEKLEIVEKEGKALEIETDNKAIKKTVDQALESYLRAVFIKKKSLAASMPLFKTDLFLRARSNAEIDFKAAPSSAGSTRKPKDVPHGALYVALREWRNSVASERDLSVYMVLPQKSLQELVKLLPTTLGELELVKGIGKTKVKHFGKEIVEIIREYCEENRIQKNTAAIAAKRKEDKEKLDTKRSSLELFKSGKVIREVAIERGMAYGTIEGHLIHFIGTGELDIYSVFKKENIDQVIAYLEENRVTSLTQIKAALGETISYSEIRAVQLYLRNQAE
jgi:hypothetical protein